MKQINNTDRQPDKYKNNTVNNTELRYLSQF